MDRTLADRLAQHLRREPAPAPMTPAAAPTLLMSIKPLYAELIAAGAKPVEFRRRVPSELRVGSLILFYVSAPVQALTMVATVKTIHRGAPARLWRQVGRIAGTRKAQFDDYFSGAATGVAIELGRVEPIHPAISLGDARLSAIRFRPPQSSRLLRAGDPLLDLIPF